MDRKFPRRSELTIEMIAVYLLALAFAVVAVIIIIKNSNKFRELLMFISSLI